MDFMAFRTIDLGPTSLEAAVPVNGYTSATWTERYRDPGEFKFVAPLSAGLQDVLPIDTLVSHAATLDLMFVESHLITEKKDEDPTIEITGRSFSAFFEHRVVSLHRNWSTEPDGLPLIVLTFNYSYEHAKELINKIINTDTYFRAEEKLDDMIADTDISGIFPFTDPVERVISRGYLSERISELLGVDDLGLRVIRRNPFGEEGDPDNTLFVIHNGKDRSASVVFTAEQGDIESSESLRTNKISKNAALVVGSWLETMVEKAPTASGYSRRELYIDAGDIDQEYIDPPTGTNKDEVLARLIARGETLLSSQVPFFIIRADISKRTRFEYRRDYNIGDIVMVKSNFGSITPMRVVEFTEIEEDGEITGHPSLDVLG